MSQLNSNSSSSSHLCTLGTQKHTGEVPQLETVFLKTGSVCVKGLSPESLIKLGKYLRTKKTLHTKREGISESLYLKIVDAKERFQDAMTEEFIADLISEDAARGLQRAKQRLNQAMRRKQQADKEVREAIVRRNKKRILVRKLFGKSSPPKCKE